MSTRKLLCGMAGATALVWLCGCEQAIGFEGYSFDRAQREALGQPVWGLDTVPAACPDATGGPALVPVRGGYCIDSTEVTREQYQAKMADMGKLQRLPQCLWKTDFTPSCNWPPDGAFANQPVSCVDWCDAWAFCEASGKRMCGRIGASGGGVVYDAENNDPKLSQWYNACSSGGGHAWPYGDAFEARCSYDSQYFGGILAVGSLEGCVSTVTGYEGVYDLAGNVGEWEDSCSGDQDGNDGCIVRGGGWRSSAQSTRCDYLQSPARSQRLDTFGIRCCAP